MHSVLEQRKQWQKQYISVGKTDLFYNSMGLCGNFTLVSFLFFRFTRIFKLKVDEKIALKCKIETGSYDDQVQKLHISAWGNFFTFFRLASPCHVPTDPRTVSNFYQIWSQHATLLLCDTRIYSGTITFVRPITSDIIQCSWLISQCLDQ